MAFDRDATLRKATRLLRQGQTDRAIAEYRRVLEEEPYDWETAERLGDLLAQAGDVEAAVAHYKRIAVSFIREGRPGADALYRKILEVKPDDDAARAEAVRLGWQPTGPNLPARGRPSTSADAPPAATASGVPDEPNAFLDFHREVSREVRNDLAAQHYKLALAYRDAGMADDAIKALEIAVRSPTYRFEAAALLGQLWLDRGVRSVAVRWLEQAAETPAASAEAGRAVLYDLATTLESMGETARALSVFQILQAAGAGYRDVSARVERLSNVQERG